MGWTIWRFCFVPYGERTRMSNPAMATAGRASMRTTLSRDTVFVQRGKRAIVHACRGKGEVAPEPAGTALRVLQNGRNNSTSKSRRPLDASLGPGDLGKHRQASLFASSPRAHALLRGGTRRM